MKQNSSYVASTGYGGIRAGQYQTTWQPNPQRPAGKFGVVLLHGSGAQIEYIDVTRPASNRMAPLLAFSGIPSVAGEMSGQAWANDAVMTDIDNAINYLNLSVGTPTNKVHLLGISMGGATMIRYSELYPAKVASMTGIIPLCNLVSFYNVQAAATKTEIETAWGAPAGGPLPAAADINANGASLTGIPAHFYYSSADATVSPADTVSFCTTYNIPLTDLGAHGHSEASIQDAINLGGTDSLSNIINFMYGNGA